MPTGTLLEIDNTGKRVKIGTNWFNYGGTPAESYVSEWDGLLNSKVSFSIYKGDPTSISFLGQEKEKPEFTTADKFAPSEKPEVKQENTGDKPPTLETSKTSDEKAKPGWHDVKTFPKNNSGNKGWNNYNSAANANKQKVISRQACLNTAVNILGEKISEKDAVPDRIELVIYTARELLKFVNE